jgi:hypothetical protein
MFIGAFAVSDNSIDRTTVFNVVCAAAEATTSNTNQTAEHITDL